MFVESLSVQVQLTKEEVRKAIELYYAMSMDNEVSWLAGVTLLAEEIKNAYSSPSYKRKELSHRNVKNERDSTIASQLTFAFKKNCWQANNLLLKFFL